MIRVLFLRRQNRGDQAEYCDVLADALEQAGVEAVVDDAESWIPNKTGWLVDRRVSKDLKRAAQGFDIVHAFGFRSAWACSEAFYVGTPWLYTAFDMPKTKHSHLIDRLNAARRGLCSCREVREALRSAEALHTEVFCPCVSDLPPLDDRTAVRSALKIAPSGKVVYWSGGASAQEGLASLLAAVEEFRAQKKEAVFVLAPWEELSDDQRAAVRAAPGRLRLLTPQDSPDMWLKASDAAVCTRMGAGFSMTAARAMKMGVPVILRRDGGLPEMASEGESGAFFDEDGGLAAKIQFLLDNPLEAEAMGRAGRARAEDRFDASTAASVLARIYKDLLDR